MRLLILGNPVEQRSLENRRYKGTYREHPYFVSSLPDAHPANQAFLWYVDAEEVTLERDFEQVKDLIRLYASLSPPQLFDVVGVGTSPESPNTDASFLGYDLTLGLHYSLLSWGLNLRELAESNAPEDEVLPLICLIEDHYKPLLNNNGLFDTEAAARSCLDCMMAVQKFRPGIWEHDKAIFEVVGLWQLNMN